MKNDKLMKLNRLYELVDELLKDPESLVGEIHITLTSKCLCATETAGTKAAFDKHAERQRREAEKAALSKAIIDYCEAKASQNGGHRLATLGMISGITGRTKNVVRAYLERENISLQEVELNTELENFAKIVRFIDLDSLINHDASLPAESALMGSVSAWETALTNYKLGEAMKSPMVSPMPAAN